MNLQSIALRIAKARWKEEGWKRPEDIDIIKSYIDSDSFAHFSNVKGRAGFNPGPSEYMDFGVNPRGLYLHPITQEFIDAIENVGQSNWKPIDGLERKYLFIIKLKPGSNIVYTDTYSNYEKDAEKLLSGLDENKRIEIEQEVEERIKERSQWGLHHTTPFAKLLEITRILSEESGWKWANTFIKLGYDTIVDPLGTLDVETDVPSTVILNPKATQVVEELNNPAYEKMVKLYKQGW